MCGIALIINGVRFDLSSLIPDYVPPSSTSHQPLFFVGDLEEALSRRGPDSLGGKKLLLYLRRLDSGEGCGIVPLLEKEGAGESKGSCVDDSDSAALENGGSDGIDNGFYLSKSVAELFFIGATLQLRGASPIVQPFVDGAGNILVYNGEIFGGVQVNKDRNDTEVLMQYLGECCSHDNNVNERIHCGNGEVRNFVPELLSKVKGPWAVIYWQNSSRTLWFGRDAFGRRSLLVHWPTENDPRLLLSSISPPSSVKQSSHIEVENDNSEVKYWEELSCGIYSIYVDAARVDGSLVGKIQKHEWTNSKLRDLIEWERTDIEPTHGNNLQPVSFDMIQQGVTQSPAVSPAENVLAALRESVMRRTSLFTIFQVNPDDSKNELVPVAVLFSGGLDSMILAAILNKCLDPIYEIDLLNVSFDGPSAPDRISARAGLDELKRVAPTRRWNLVEIDAELSKLNLETKHVTSLIYPANTYMDLNIGIALWLAAGGDGWVYEKISNNIDEDRQCVKYKSKARILLVGSGADEQCAGYGRHRTKYRNGSWLGLYEEMKLDMQRIWKRNLGRDDRLISDNGKEARFPFLDEDVIRTLLNIPLWEVADLNEPSGKGDKKILREVARLLGLHNAAVLPKRAIQFGSRIAMESNRKNFGSNRAANQASAGSVVFCKSAN